MNSARRYLAVYEHRKSGYSGFVPDFPGCMASGSSLLKMQESIRRAVNSFIAERKQRGEEMPQALTHIVHFPHPSEGHGIDHWVVESVEVLFTKSGRAIRSLKARRRKIKRAQTADPSHRRHGDSLRMTTRKRRKEI
jgi:predicted RNase H-like HicB family nuclease